MSEQVIAPRQRPIGVTIISILEALGGLFYIILGILAFVVGSAAGAQNAALGAAGSIAGVILIIIGLIALFLAWGLWTLKRWAFWVTAVLQALAFIFGLISIIGGNHSAQTIIQAVVALVIVVYLFADRNVRAAFRT